MVAAYALGLTPLVFLVAGLLFVLTTLTYFEGMTLHPERGGSAVMARYAFNELVSFIAGWAILLDYLILIAIARSRSAHYLTAFWSEFAATAASSRSRDRGARRSWRSLQLPRLRRARRQRLQARSRSSTWRCSSLMIVRRARSSSSTRARSTDKLDLGTVPKWSDLVFGVIARDRLHGDRGGRRTSRPRCAWAAAPAPDGRRRRGRVLLVFVGMSPSR